MSVEVCSHLSEWVHSSCPVSVESFLVIFHIPCQVQFYLHLGFSDPASASPDSIPVLFPGDMPLFPELVRTFLRPQCAQQVLAEPCWFPISSAHFPIQVWRPLVLLDRKSVV